MKLVLFVFALVASVICGDAIPHEETKLNITLVDWPPKLDRNAPCPHPNMERKDGGSATCDENCEDVRALREGREKPIKPCILIYIYNECHCKEGFVRKSEDEAECVAKKDC